MDWYESVGESREVQGFFYRCRRCHAVFVAFFVGGRMEDPPFPMCAACQYVGEPSPEET